VIAAIGDPLHSCLEHVAFYHKRREGSRGNYARWLRSFGKNAPYLQAKEASPMENRTAFGEMSKRQERTAVTVYGVIEVPADCPHLWQNWWKAAGPLSGDGRR